MNRRIGRTILNTLPEWALFLVFAGGTAAVAIAVLLLVRRLFPTWRTIESSQVVVGVAAMVMTLFAVMIAFAVVTLDGSFSGANDNVQTEANSLNQIVQNMRLFPPPVRHRIELAVGAYAQEVREHEFEAMHDGHADPRAARALDRLLVAVQSVAPVTHAQSEFYDLTVDAVSRVSDTRNKRLAAATASLPEAFWVLIILTAVVGLGTTFFLKVETLGLEALMVVAVAVVIGVGIMTTLLLEYPFSGSVSVSSGPFSQGALAPGG